jgi:hypothetical protein
VVVSIGNGLRGSGAYAHVETLAPADVPQTVQKLVDVLGKFLSGLPFGSQRIESRFARTGCLVNRRRHEVCATDEVLGLRDGLTRCFE